MESSKIESLLWQHCCKNIKVYNEASTLQKKASLRKSKSVQLLSEKITRQDKLATLKKELALSI